MRILSWNLWWRYGPWEQRREAIAATLAEVEPDVCGLQEVWGASGENQAADLAERLGVHWCWTAASKERDGLTLGNAILSRWPITEQAHAELPAGGPAEEGRMALQARIDMPGGALPMFTTHLTYGLGRSQVRVAQVRALAEFAAGRAADCAYPPVVTGDLNAEPGSDELRLLGGLLTAPAAPGLVLIDAWRYADPGDPGFTWDRRNGYQASSIVPDSRIDYILVGPHRQGRGRVRSVRLGGTAPVDGVWPSDHFAVVAELQQQARIRSETAPTSVVMRVPGEAVARLPDGTEAVRYSDYEPAVGMVGEVEALGHYAGQSAGPVSAVRPAGVIVREIAGESVKASQAVRDALAGGEASRQR